MHFFDHRRVVGRNEVGEHLRAAGGAPAFGAEDVLLGDGNAGQRPGAAGSNAGIGSGSHGQRFFAVYGDEGVDVGVQALDPVEEERAQFDAGDFPGRQCLRQLLECLVDHSITFGTR